MFRKQRSAGTIMELLSYERYPSNHVMKSQIDQFSFLRIVKLMTPLYQYSRERSIQNFKLMLSLDV